MSRLFGFSVACLFIGGLASAASAQTIAGGSKHTVVVTPESQVWTWDSSSNGGWATAASANANHSARSPTFSDVVAVAAGSLHTLLLRSDGSVWRYNGAGRIGDGTNLTRSNPVFVSGLSSIVAIAAGESHSVALPAPFAATTTQTIKANRWDRLVSDWRV